MPVYIPSTELPTNKMGNEACCLDDSTNQHLMCLNDSSGSYLICSDASLVLT